MIEEGIASLRSQSRTTTEAVRYRTASFFLNVDFEYANNSG